MNYYALIKEEKILGVGQCYCTSDGCICIEITEEQYNTLSEAPYKYEYINGEIVYSEEKDIEHQKQERKQEILKELDELDLKSIRAIRSNDTEYIAEYEQQAEALREELRTL